MYHGGREFVVDFEVISECFGKPSKRMITEAVMIEQLDDSETMNSKREWTFTKLDKIYLT